MIFYLQIDKGAESEWHQGLKVVVLAVNGKCKFYPVGMQVEAFGAVAGVFAVETVTRDGHTES